MFKSKLQNIFLVAEFSLYFSLNKIFGLNNAGISSENDFFHRRKS